MLESMQVGLLGVQALSDAEDQVMLRWIHPQTV